MLLALVTLGPCFVSWPNDICFRRVFLVPGVGRIPVGARLLCCCVVFSLVNLDAARRSCRGGGAILILLSVVRNERITFSITYQIAVVMVITMSREAAATGALL